MSVKSIKKRYVISGCIISAFLISSSVSLADDKPNPNLTPGDVLTTDSKVVCVKGYTRTVRDVPESLKKKVYLSYGITHHKHKEYEVDHLISLELGGSNSIKNLWPESYVTKPLNAHIKDVLENKLHSLVCQGKLDLKEAQKEIAEDWIKAYTRYIGPLPKQND